MKGRQTKPRLLHLEAGQRLDGRSVEADHCDVQRVERVARELEEHVRLTNGLTIVMPCRYQGQPPHP